MKLHIIARGKIGRGPEADLVERYLGRIGWDCQVTELGEYAQPKFAIHDSGIRSIVLDERGKALSSDALAALLTGWRDDGTREVRFWIGGADGHNAETRAQADELLSFGPATWPHLLVRAMLAEQLYRAYTISIDHPYHRRG